MDNHHHEPGTAPAGVSRIARQVNRGDVLSVDWATGKVINQTTGQTTGLVTAAQPLSPYVLAILENGGIKPMIRKQMRIPSTHAGEKT
jgi:3-isopropylmalate dehydratase small subunit